MGPAREGDGESLAAQTYPGLALDEEPIDLGRIAGFKSPQFPGQEAVEGIGDHGHDHIKVHLHQNGGRERIEVEELDGLGDHVFHPPAAGIVAHEKLGGGGEVIGDEKGGLFAPIAADDDLPQISPVIGQRDGRFMYGRVGVFSLAVGDVDALPGRERFEGLDHGFSPAPQRDEVNPSAVQLREIGITGELGVKDKGGLKPPVLLFPEGEKSEDLVAGLIALDVGCGVEDELGGRVLGKQGQRPLHSLVAGAGPVILQYRLLPVVGDGVEVQVDQIGLVEPQPDGLLDEALLQPHQMQRIQAVGVGGHRGALGQHIEAGEKPQARIEGMLGEMRVALGADQLQGEKGQKVAQRGDGLCAGQSRLLHDVGQVELVDEGGKQHHPGGLGLPGTLGHLAKLKLLGHGRHLGPFDCQSELQAASSGQFGEALLGQDPLDRSHRDLDAFLGQKRGDLSGRQPLLAPATNLGFEGRIEPSAVGLALGDGFGEVDLLVGEQVPEQVHIGQGVAEALGDDTGGQPLDKGGSQGLIAALPFVDGPEEEALIAHKELIQYGGYNVNI